MTALEQSHLSLKAVKTDSRTSASKPKRGADPAGQSSERKIQQTVAITTMNVVSRSRYFHNFFGRNPVVRFLG
jgi:hypothetical protein